MASEGLNDGAGLDVEDFDDARGAADGEEWVGGCWTAGPGGGAEGFGGEEEVVLEVADYFEAGFGVRAGDDGFFAADDGEDGVDSGRGEGVEVGAIVGVAGGALSGWVRGDVSGCLWGCGLWEGQRLVGGRAGGRARGGRGAGEGTYAGDGFYSGELPGVVWLGVAWLGGGCGHGAVCGVRGYIRGGSGGVRVRCEV